MPSQTTHMLDVYVAEACFGCDRAREIAARVRAWALPDVLVRLLELDDPAIARPDVVFAVPTWLLDGQVISLGNPDETWLYDLLTSTSGRPTYPPA